jgi:hypothetical protein
MQYSVYFAIRCKFFCDLKMFCGHFVVIALSIADSTQALNGIPACSAACL